MKKLLSLISLMLVSTSPAVARDIHTTQQGRAEHMEIVRALDEVGVDLLVNEPQFCDSTVNGGNFLGAYFPYIPAVIVCQEDALIWSGKPVKFTEEDLDTLRHEAYHVAQDCADGMMDGDLVTIIKSDGIIKALSQDFGLARMNRIIQVYRNNGADENSIRVEVEAWVVASELPAAYVVESLRRFCN